jgi:queuine/archaeosine tRNA-ribosyltransferase
LSVDEPTAPRLLTWHNVHWTFDLVRRVRHAIEAGGLATLRAQLAERWGGAGNDTASAAAAGPDGESVAGRG